MSAVLLLQRRRGRVPHQETPAGPGGPLGGPGLLPAVHGGPERLPKQLVRRLLDVLQAAAHRRAGLAHEAKVTHVEGAAGAPVAQRVELEAVVLVVRLDAWVPVPP